MPSFTPVSEATAESDAIEADPEATGSDETTEEANALPAFLNEAAE